MLFKGVLQSVTSVHCVFHLLHSLALGPFDPSWIFIPLLWFGTFMHVATTTRAFACILKTCDVAHIRAMCEKTVFLRLINRPVPSSPLTHAHMITHTLGFAHTHPHTHTCVQTWLLKVLTWAMALCQLFPVGRLSTCFFP